MSSTQHLAARRERLDIQGLRAVAVLAVIAHHVWGYPSGGFVGVDIFFVLSGFLITDILLRDHEQNGTIGVAAFYRRRVRRIVPAALLVIVTTIAATYYVVGGARAREVLVDRIWSAHFVSNWRFADIGSDYIRSDGLTSPLQHFWPLAIAAQLYLVWPWVMRLVLGLSAVRQHRRLVLFSTMTVIVGASFVYSMWHTAHAPSWGFSTLDRTWEFGVGALLAIARPALAHLPAPVRLASGWVGLGLIASSVFRFPVDSASAAAWAVACVVGTAVAIAAGVAAEQRVLFPLVNPVTTYIGDISYSLYLWHFPAVVLLLAYFPDGGWRYWLSVLVVTGAAAVVSHKAVEDPIRRSQWLEPGVRDRRARRRRDGLQVPPGLARSWAVAASCVVVALTIVGWPNPAVLSGPPPASVAGTGVEAGATPAAGPIAERQHQRVVSSLEATDFPVLEPGLDELGIAKWAEEVDERVCLDVSKSTAADCVFGEEAAPRTAVVLGDAFGAAWMGAVLGGLPADEYRVHQITKLQCPAWDVPVDPAGGANAECDGFRRWAFREIDRIKPDLLILSSYHYRGYEIENVDKTDGAIAEAVVQGLARTLARTGAAKSTVILAPPPGTGNLQECATKAGSPQDCIREIPAIWTAVSGAESFAADALDAIYIDTSGWFCSSGRCPGFIGSTPVTADGAHITWKSSSELGPVLREALLKAEAVPAAAPG